VLSQIVTYSSRSTIPSDQRRWRNEVVTLMARQGFVNYARPWVHFSLPAVARPPMVSWSATLILSPTEYR
jgi:zinc D-Ala-D-Ala dipeptidase